ncbi:Adaptin N terminal region family protein [Tritrichomonas foetus]|uniref:Adaptin N terminal region family protein n=1 Tax=Tritrichomonas foetus TaxID=1144522 RepID=A0A1J4K0I0_9EUKA|nr:Adaptin N terminal region family protein [Tritrichomonas foetus]|eukprot:OHT04929.1 Adaptin N terminal region family protein [Tritrichomonas foetus]
MHGLIDGSSDEKSDIITIRNQLDGNDATYRKIAAKRVVNLMRSGENVQSLFSSMLRCVKTSDIELKKLIYLYLINYSSQEPEQAIMAVNTFIQDSQDENPLVRALAVRNMCRIRIESVAEHMIIPLKKCLCDPNPYVRKTSALSVSKLYDIIPESIENADIFNDLLALLHDGNPMVVANTTAAICEINERRTTPIFEFNSKTLHPVLNALHNSSEWCQILILDTVAKCVPEGHKAAKHLIERLEPFLKNRNPAVVVGAFKAIFMLMEYDKRSPMEIFPTIIPPFISLCSSAEPEIQYVVLQTVLLFVQKYPKALSKEIRFFFCKYNDPSFVKMVKLDIIIQVMQPVTVTVVLEELTEYTNEVDVAFVRKTIRCIGQIAVKIEASARRCVDILMTCLTGKADYAVEEAIIVICDILRKFPGDFESVLGPVCGSLERVNDPKAKASAIWLLGEFCQIIDKVDILLDPFLDTFHDEQPLVQLQILTALVKIFICKPDQTRDQLQFVLNEATKDSNVPDVKNRALLYWRLLSNDTSIAKSIIVFDKQTITDSGVHFDQSVLDELIKNMGTVSGVLHVVPSDFVRRVKYVPEDDSENLNEDELRNWVNARLTDETYLSLSVDFDPNNMYLRLVNKSPAQLSQFAVALNTNAIGLTIAQPPSFPEMLEFGDNAEVSVPIRLDPSQVGNIDKTDLQIALRTNVGNIFGTTRIPIEIATTADGNIGQDGFRMRFSSYQCGINVTVEATTIADDSLLAERNVFVVGKNNDTIYVSFSLSPQHIFVAELKPAGQNFIALVKAENNTFLPLIENNAPYLFAHK